MAEEVTYLNVPQDAAGHAARFGAKRDPGTSTWYVVGPIHSELRNYVPRPTNQRFHELAPLCPSCGGPTRKIVNRWGQPFWSCVAHFSTGCPGTVDYLDYLDDVAPSAFVGDYLPKVVASLLGPAEPPAPPTEKPSHPLKARWGEIVQEAAGILGGDRKAAAWLLQGKLAFLNKAPVEMLGTEAGCDAVLKLLREVWK